MVAGSKHCAILRLLTATSVPFDAKEIMIVVAGEKPTIFFIRMTSHRLDAGGARLFPTESVIHLY